MQWQRQWQGIYFLWFQLSRGSQSPSLDQCWQCSFLYYPYKYTLKLLPASFVSISKNQTPYLTRIQVPSPGAELDVKDVKRIFCTVYWAMFTTNAAFSVFGIISPLWLVQRGKARIINLRGFLALTWDKLKHRIVQHPEQHGWGHPAGGAAAQGMGSHLLAAPAGLIPSCTEVQLPQKLWNIQKS